MALAVFPFVPPFWSSEVLGVIGLNVQGCLYGMVNGEIGNTVVMYGGHCDVY